MKGIENWLCRVFLIFTVQWGASILLTERAPVFGLAPSSQGVEGQLLLLTVNLYAKLSPPIVYSSFKEL